MSQGHGPHGTHSVGLELTDTNDNYISRQSGTTMSLNIMYMYIVLIYNKKYRVVQIKIESEYEILDKIHPL